MGKTAAIAPDPAFEGHDLPRGAGTTQKAKRQAIIPDQRNDENLAVAQTHLAIIRFHNRIVDTLPASVPAAQRFAKARELAVKHYQWMLRHDYLPRICEPSDRRRRVRQRAQGVRGRRQPARRADDAGRVLGRRVPARSLHDPARLQLEQALPGPRRARCSSCSTSRRPAASLGGFPRLPSNWIADFRRLYDFKGEAGKDNLAAPGGLNRAMRIDTLLVGPLRSLPKGSFGGKAADEGTIAANLAFRNLARAKMVKLATGQKMVAFLKSKGVWVTALTKAQIRNGNGGAQLDDLTPAQREGLAKNTPLWFYVLREAELNDGVLKGAGARIVAETFHRAMEGSQHSIVRDPAWRPTFGPELDDVPDGRPAAVRVRGEEEAARSARLAARRRPGGGRARTIPGGPAPAPVRVVEAVGGRVEVDDGGEDLGDDAAADRAEALAARARFGLLEHVEPQRGLPGPAQVDAPRPRPRRAASRPSRRRPPRRDGSPVATPRCRSRMARDRCSLASTAPVICSGRLTSDGTRRPSMRRDRCGAGGRPGRSNSCAQSATCAAGTGPKPTRSGNSRAGGMIALSR